MLMPVEIHQMPRQQTYSCLPINHVQLEML